VEHDSQNKILISHKDEMPKKIGMEARKELEALFDSKIYLRLFVKVVLDCRESPESACARLAFPARTSSEDQGTGE
jgi:GTP-binding protein Era